MLVGQVCKRSLDVWFELDEEMKNALMEGSVAGQVLRLLGEELVCMGASVSGVCDHPCSQQSCTCTYWGVCRGVKVDSVRPQALCRPKGGSYMHCLLLCAPSLHFLFH